MMSNRPWLKVLIGAGMAFLFGPAGVQATVCPTGPGSVLCTILTNETRFIGGTIISTTMANPPLAFELRGDSYLINTGIARLTGEGMVIGTNYFSQTSAQHFDFRLVNEASGTLFLDGTGFAPLVIEAKLNNVGILHARSGSSSIIDSSNLRDGLVKVDSGASLRLSDAYINDNSRFENNGQLSLGLLYTYGTLNNVDFGPGRVEFAGHAFIATSFSAGSLLMRTGELQGNLNIAGMATVAGPPVTAPSFSPPKFWLNTFNAPAAANFGGLTVESGLLRVAANYSITVTGDLLFQGGQINLHSNHPGIVMTSPNPAEFARLGLGTNPFADESGNPGFGRITVNRNVFVTGALSGAITNNALMRFYADNSTDVAGSFDPSFINNGTVEITQGIVRGGAKFNPYGGTFSVGINGTLELDGGGLISFDNLTNWNAATTTLTGGAFRIIGGELRLPGVQSVITNASRLELVGNAVVTNEFGQAVFDFNNKGHLKFESYGDSYRGSPINLTNQVASTATFFFSNMVVNSLTNRGILAVYDRDANSLLVDSLYVDRLESDLNPTTGTPYGYDNGRFIGGDWRIGDGARLTIRHGFGPIESLAASITLSGAGSALIDANTGLSALAPLREIERNTGRLVLKDGANFTVAPGVVLINRGHLEVGAGSLLTASDGLEQRDGTLKIDGTFQGNLSLMGGWLRGSGAINGTTFVETNIGPGTSPGQLTINGDLTLANTAVLEIEVEGTDPGFTSDLLTVTGVVSLGGKLQVVFGGPFIFTQATTLTFLQGASEVVGSFASLEVLGGAGRVGGVDYRVFFDANAGAYVGVLDIAPVPEPGSYMLLLAGLGLIGFVAKRRNSNAANVAAAV